MSTEVLSPNYSSSKFAHTGATTAKLFYLINGVVWLALNTALANADNIFVYAADQVRVPKATGTAWSPGDKIYWDDTAKNFTKTVGSNTLAGIVNEAAASGDAEGIIDLRPFLA